MYRVRTTFNSGTSGLNSLLLCTIQVFKCNVILNPQLNQGIIGFCRAQHLDGRATSFPGK